MSGHVFSGIAVSSFGPGTLPFPAAGLPFAFAASTNVPPVVSHGSNGQGFTSVVVDLSGHGAAGGVDREKMRGFMTYHPGLPTFTANMDEQDYINGRIIVQMAGSDAQQAFPVKFFKHSSDNPLDNNGLFDSYRASLMVRMAHDGAGLPPGLELYTPDDVNNSSEAFFTFNGEIMIANPQVQPSLMAGSPGDTYNNTITLGQTVYHQSIVTGQRTSLNFDLKWQNPQDDLRLTVYTPDGHVLGPYTDSSDGTKDGRINMEIDNPSGVADGTWSYKVTGSNVTGKDEYYIRTS
jgi:hypothetical protein